MLFVEPLRSPARTRQPGSCCRDVEFPQLLKHYITMTRQEALKLFQALGTVLRTVSMQRAELGSTLETCSETTCPDTHMQSRNGDLYECVHLAAQQETCRYACCDRRPMYVCKHFLQCISDLLAVCNVSNIDLKTYIAGSYKRTGLPCSAQQSSAKMGLSS